MLTGMKQDMNERFDTSVDTSIFLMILSGLRDEVTKMTQEVEEVKTENEQLKTENCELTDRLENGEKKLDDLEDHSKRNNLIFMGLQKQTAADYKSWEDCEKLVNDLICDQLKTFNLTGCIDCVMTPRLLSLPDSPTSKTSRMSYDKNGNERKHHHHRGGLFKRNL